MKIGILGGGQLSKMLALAGISLGFEFSILFAEKSCSLSHLGEIFHASDTDIDSLNKFAQSVDVITYENENISLSTLEYLEHIKPIYPDMAALKVSQDRLLEKRFFEKLAIPTNQFLQVNTFADLEHAARQLGYPFILKKRTHGYDGRGQIKINNASELASLQDHHVVDTIAEEYVAFDREVSLIAVRNTQGSCAFYDLCENVHNHGILIKTINKIKDPMFMLAKHHVEKILAELNYVGVLAVEFFQKNDQLLANEMAPRVHNSGHWTIDACVTSQFENHLRSIVGWPLGSTASLTPAVMFNLISTMPAAKKLLEWPNSRLYDYCKEPKPKRKLGHVTLVQDEASLSNDFFKIVKGENL